MADPEGVSSKDSWRHSWLPFLHVYMLLLIIPSQGVFDTPGCRLADCPVIVIMHSELDARLFCPQVGEGRFRHVTGASIQELFARGLVNDFHVQCSVL